MPRKKTYNRSEVAGLMDVRIPPQNVNRGTVVSLHESGGSIEPFPAYKLPNNQNVRFQYSDIVIGCRVQLQDIVEYNLRPGKNSSAMVIRLMIPDVESNFATFVQSRNSTSQGSSRRSLSASGQHRNQQMTLQSQNSSDRNFQQRQESLLIDDGAGSNQNPNVKSFQQSNSQSKLFQGGKKHAKRNVNDARMKIPSVSMSGTIVKLMSERSGSIKTFLKLPEDYAQNQNVHFNPLFVKSGGLPAKVGDTLEFSLGTKDKSRPMAFAVRLTKATSRSSIEIEALVDDISKKLNNATGECVRKKNVYEEDDDDEEGANEKSLNRIDWLLEVLSCGAMWAAIGNCVELSFSAIKSTINLLLSVERESQSMLKNFENIVGAFAKTRILDSNIGRLRFYIEDIVQHKNQDDLTKVRNVLLLVLRHAPEKTHSVVSLIKLMVSKDKTSTENFLLTAIKEIAKQNCDELDDVEWCDLPLVPTSTELVGGYQEYFCNLSPVLVTGSYRSSAEYLDTYFRLLRADCFGSLCKYVQELLLGNLDHRNMNVYHSVRIVGVAVTTSDTGIAVRLEVTPCMPVKNWATTSKLMFGNLICISPTGSFKDAIWATIVNRDLDMLKNRHVDVELCSLHNRHTDAELIILMSQAGSSMVVVESPTYYHAYKPVLKSLQDIDPEHLPFQEELIKGKQSKERPDYVNSHIEKLASSSVDGKDYIQRTDFYDSISATWPETLDKYQEEALKQVFFRRIACIQGPPGTGKTFIGIAVIRTILAMEQRPEGPILVLTYKNHALDEFLKDLLKYFPGEVVRVGGRSKDEELANCNLKEVKGKVKKSKFLYECLTDKRNEIASAMPDVKRAAMAVNDSLTLSVATVIHFMTKNQLIGLLSGCDWSMCYGKWKNPEKLAGKFAQSTYSAERFFFNDATKMSQLEFALNKWRPSAAVLRSEEMKNVSALQSSLKASSVKDSTASLQEVQAQELLLQDEKDIEDVQEERLAAVGKKSINANDVVEFKNTKASTSFFRFIGDLEVDFVHRFRAISDVWSLTPEKRVKLINCLLLQQLEQPAEKFEDDLLYYQQLCAEKKEFDDQHKISILKSMKVIGMTITGASINAHLLASVKPAIVVIEEAAEVLEPQIVATLGSWVQHLIMIGDHKQLRPPVESYELTTQFRFDISMMERLINNDVPYNSLAIQNRMRPEFSALLLDIYPELKNSQKVKLNVPAACMKKSMFFWQHTDQEQYSRSYSNTKEADRAVRLALFLIQQGCALEQITILAAYQGQVALIRQKLESAKNTYNKLFLESKEQQNEIKEAKLPILNAKNSLSPAALADAKKKEDTIKVHTIDMYQGDENDYIIVSLVRSNPRKAIGFLKLLNRRCVAQSRSRCGLYFIGDVETLSVSADWACLIEGMRKSDCLGSSITLICPKHPVSKISATTAEDITLGSFCTIICNEALKGCTVHRCKKPCQPPHGHARCDESVAFEFSRCGHPAKKLCYQDEEIVPCEFDCKEAMQCGMHRCSRKCNPEHPHHYCIEDVKFICAKCATENTKMCSQPEAEVQCTGKITYKRTDCGHISKRSCYESEDIKCREKCVKTLVSCGHPCQLQCGDACNTNSDACKACNRLREIEQEKQRQLLEEARKLKIAELNKEYEELKKCEIKVDFWELPLVAEGDTAVEYCKVYDMVMNYIKDVHNWFPTITGISKVCNQRLREAYLKCRLALFDPSVEELKFHGTKAWREICTEGFRLPTSTGMYGKGIYFATDSSKSAQKKYTKGSHTLLLCQVGLGRAHVVYTHQSKLDRKQLALLRCDSVFAKRNTRETGGVEFDEFVVYRAEQAIPMYIIRYDTVESVV